MGNLAQRVALSSFFYQGIPYPPVSRLNFFQLSLGNLSNYTQKNRLVFTSPSFVFLWVYLNCSRLELKYSNNVSGKPAHIEDMPSLFSGIKPTPPATCVSIVLTTS